MAFSNSFSSIHMNRSESAVGEEEIVEEMSFGRQTKQTGYKWASVPTLNNAATTTEELLELCSFDGQLEDEEDYNSDVLLPETNECVRVRERGESHHHHSFENGEHFNHTDHPSLVTSSQESQSTSSGKPREDPKEFLLHSPLSMEVEHGKDFKGDVNGGKKCDLIAELVENQNEIGRDMPIDQMAASMMSSFDNNGNPLSLEEQGLVNVNEIMEGKGGGGAEGFVRIEQQQQLNEPVEMGESNKQSMHEKIENPIKFGFKSTLQKSVEGFIDEPKYFINAAALSEDLETYTLPSLKSDTGDDDEGDQVEDNLRKTEDDMRKKCQENNSTTKTKNTMNEVASRLPVSMVKPRVPMSKSFPDIIQTTFVDERNRDDFSKKLIHAETMKEKETSFNDLTADSLEELHTTDSGPHFDTTFKTPQQQPNEQRHYQFQSSGKFQPDFKTSENTHHKLDDLMTISQSQMGILSEKPPEAWVIDFNSLSMDSENFDSEMSSSIKSSNPNSLAFFIDMDENSTASESTKKEVKSPDKKKIFSMFVDFGSQPEKAQQQQQQQQQQSHPVPHHHPIGNKPSRLPVHRNVMNVLKDGEVLQFPTSQTQSYSSTSSNGSTGGGGQAKGLLSHVSGAGTKKCNFQYPSPILQHKAAAEAARKNVTKMEISESEGGEGSNAENQSKEEEKVSSTTTSTSNLDPSNSNRSSLHVATNDFDMMNFSSSFISSMETSAPEEEICSKGPCFKLGKDLLRMFEDGINTDVKICVNGRYLRAHKCILSSRSQYFAAIFSGPWIEKAGNTIPLNGFSYNVVHFTMCHIYSGTNEIPDSIDLLELATLTDLLGLEGLRENISQTIRVKFCHNFHRPCTACISGVLECFPIALSYEMDELHRKMTKWICKHFVRIWPTKAFANLGDELIEKCLRYSVNHLSVDNILDITLGCDQLLTTMPSVRWTEPIFSVVNQMSEACVQFIGENFSQVIQCQRFLLFGKGQQWNISRIEGTFGDAMLLMKPDEACLSHAALCRLIELGTHTIDEVEWSTMFVDFLKMLAKEIERYLTGNASKAVLSKYWEHLGQDVRKRICTTSFLGYDKAGNKIVKGNTAAGEGNSGGGNTKTSGQGRLTERSSSISSLKSNASSTKTSSSRHGDHPKSVSSNSNNHSTKTNSTAKNVASVRPIQNVLPTTTGDSRTVGQKGSSKSNHRNQHPPQNSSSARLQKTVEVTKEKSFSNSPRNSVGSTTASASRTPMTPSKPGPGLVGSSPLSTTTTGKTRSVKSSANVTATATQPPAPASKSTFVTNSARANAVSKPTLRSKNVSSTLSTTTRTTTPRTPNLSQPSRYASSHVGAGRNSRVSLSGEDKIEKVSSPVTSLPTNTTELSKTRTGRTAPGGVSGPTSSSSGRKSNNNKNSNGSSVNTSNASSRKTSAKLASGCCGSSSGVVEQYMEPMRDSVMSKSTIETDTGEPKMRTLAEIGRSSTFSKDEPTILRKNSYEDSYETHYLS